MEEIIVDDKYKIHFSKELINLFKIKPKDRFHIKIENKDKIVLEKIKKSRKEKDSLIEILDSPAHISIDKLKHINLNAVEEELWTRKSHFLELTKF